MIQITSIFGSLFLYFLHCSAFFSAEPGAVIPQLSIQSSAHTTSASRGSGHAAPFQGSSSCSKTSPPWQNPVKSHTLGTSRRNHSLWNSETFHSSDLLKCSLNTSHWVLWSFGCVPKTGSELLKPQNLQLLGYVEHFRWPTHKTPGSVS